MIALGKQDRTTVDEGGDGLHVGLDLLALEALEAIRLFPFNAGYICQARDIRTMKKEGGVKRRRQLLAWCGRARTTISFAAFFFMLAVSPRSSLP